MQNHHWQFSISNRTPSIREMRRAEHKRTVQGFRVLHRQHHLSSCDFFLSNPPQCCLQLEPAGVAKVCHGRSSAVCETDAAPLGNNDWFNSTKERIYTANPGNLRKRDPEGRYKACLRKKTKTEKETVQRAANCERRLK